MKPSSIIYALCALFASCAGLTTPEKQPEYYSNLLSATDIAQIKALVASRPNIKQPVWEIATHEGRSDRATVSTGQWGKAGDESDYFDVSKRNGKWRIISPIKHDRLKAEDILVTS